MGGNMSHIEDSDESPREHQSRIVACHSKEQWNTHFDAVQDSNKLYADKFTDVEFVKLDVDEFPGEAMQFSVQEMPSFVFLKGVEVVDKLVGARKDELQKKIENHRNCDYNVCF
ncbi:hypothetical protein ACFX14_011619 [Malus domestica]